MRRLSIAYEWQDAVIRAAITLKLSNFEETGGIVAALTTSIPEAPGSGRTWDYRYCWLRDAYFVVKALNRLGATAEDGGFHLLHSRHCIGRQVVRPVYSIVPSDPMDEEIAPAPQGLSRQCGPVRIGNAAAGQVQHDTFGSVILAAMPMFFDRRLPRPGDAALFHLLESSATGGAARLRARCRHLGISRPQPGAYPFGGDVLGGLQPPRRHRGASRHDRPCRALGRHRRRHPARNLSRQPGTRNAALSPPGSGSTISTPACCCSPNSGWWTRQILGSFAPSRRSSGNFCAATTLCGTRARMTSALPESEFLVCRFWLIDAGGISAAAKQARRHVRRCAASTEISYGLLAEDIHPVPARCWAIFPQTYSMAGLILTAMRLSRSWEDRYWHD